MTMKSLSQQCGMMLLLVIFINVLLVGFVPFTFASPVIRRFQFNVSLKKKVPHLFGCKFAAIYFVLNKDGCFYMVIVISN